MKSAEILSNTVLLAANAYLLGSGVQNYVRDRRQERISGSLQTAAEVAAAAAGLTKVVTETIARYHVPAD